MFSLTSRGLIAFFLRRILFVFLVLSVFFCKDNLDSQDLLRTHPKQGIVVPSHIEFYHSVLPTLKGKQAILITNPSGIGNNPEELVSKFAINQVTIQSLIGLEHGFLGLEEDFSNKSKSLDPTLGLPVYHIYKLKQGELKGILSSADVIVLDVQDMGMRCYTYLTVLKRVMDNMKSNQLLVVLDHVNPGIEMGVRGDLLQKGYENFAAEFPLPLFTGLTLGESALYYNEEHLKGKRKVQVIKVQNYQRRLRFEKTGLVWNTPSPNLPTLDSARNYFAMVLLEGVNLSVGRGTQGPFLYFGAPWLKSPEEYAKSLDLHSENKYYFQPVFFRPTFSKYSGKICRGLRMEIVNPDYDPIELGYKMISSLKAQYPENFSWAGTPKRYMIDLLWGSDRFRKAIDEGKSYEDFRKSFQGIEKEYSKKIEKYFLYPR
jgi:uncharacterized protein YbbC (DUF1343 family)